MKVTKKEILETKHNNFIKKQPRIIRQHQALIYAVALFGINRLYLFQDKKLLYAYTLFYSGLLIAITTFIVFVYKMKESIFFLYKELHGPEFVLLVIISSTLQKNTLLDYYNNLTKFDEMLKISDEIKETTPVARAMCWLMISMFHSMIEYLFLLIYVHKQFDYAVLIIYISLMAHDADHVYYNFNLYLILRRVFVLRGHVQKMFKKDKSENFDNKDMTKLISFSKYVNLDIIKMHRAYDLLHECARQLNFAMSLPMILMLLTAGLSTTILLTNIIKMAQQEDETDVFYMMIGYAVMRCFKYTMQVILPCVYSSETTREVTIIRTLLHDATHIYPLDKIERRQVKAFFQLTKDNEFAYALWGIIKLNMSLPLSYSSLCTTYLVIFIQFSKFTD